jgi:NAD(P)-dependent dehydrogenase (short-subunit alcohol dehydrogenase family)
MEQTFTIWRSSDASSKSQLKAMNDMSHSFPRVVAVAGASSGIGRAVADRLSRLYAVYGGSRRTPNSPSWVYHPLDVADAASVSDFIDFVLARERRIDALVACAGFGLAGPVEATADDEALRQLDVNVLGCHRLIRAVLPSMRSRGHGKIIIIGSIGGLIGLPFASFYSASKFALAGLVEALRGEIEPLGIDATIVHPGDLNTEFGRHRVVARAARSSPAYADAFEKTLRFYAEQEEAGPLPDALARTIERLLARRRLPARVIHGTVLERLGVLGQGGPACACV